MKSKLEKEYEKKIGIEKKGFEEQKLMRKYCILLCCGIFSKFLKKNFFFDYIPELVVE